MHDLITDSLGFVFGGRWTVVHVDRWYWWHRWHIPIPRLPYYAQVTA